jgi:hypothetical protein
MDPFIDRTPAEPTDAEELRASRTFDRLAAGGMPADRMEAGLAFAMVAGRDVAGNPQIEDRRFAMAYARGLARMRTAGDERPAIGSIDWARTFCVDASIQREAEKSLGMDVLDRQERHRWGSKWTRDEHWVQAGVSPSVFAKAADEELLSMASGRFHEILPGRGRPIETALMSSMAPALPSMEAGLHQVASTPVAMVGDNRLEEGARIADEKAFGPMPAGVDGIGMATLSDRIEMAARAREVGHRDARGLHDSTPGRHPFVVTEADRTSAATAMRGGSAPLARVASAARIVHAGLGLGAGAETDARLQSALARLAKRGPDPTSGMSADVRGVVADVLIQQAASDRLLGRGTAAEDALERMVSNTPGGRDSVRFTGIASDRPSVVAVAEGRFGDLDDSRGFASAVRSSMWKAGIGSSPEIDRIVERVSAPRAPMSKGPDLGTPQGYPRQARGSGR